MSGYGEDDKTAPAEILAVDDVPANLLALSGILEPLESRLVTARSGREALRLAAGSEFAVILLDVMMPEMDGFETLARLREMPACRGTPIVLVTAYELDALALERVRRLGPIDYVFKPIAAELLRSKVASLVSLHRRGEELRRRDEALAAKDRHIAVLAHDLQSPLAAMLASTSLVLRRDLDAATRSGVARIERAAARMSEMVRNLTEHARAGRGPIPIVRSPMDMSEVCREVVEDLRLADSRPIDLVCTGDLRGQWDRNRLYQRRGSDRRRSPGDHLSTIRARRTVPQGTWARALHRSGNREGPPRRCVGDVICRRRNDLRPKASAQRLSVRYA